MPTAIVTFKELRQDSQEYGSDNEHMGSRVFFDLRVGEKDFPDLHVDIKQTIGSSIDTASLEVSSPVGYNGPMDHEKLSRAAEAYYRSFIGSTGSAFNFTGGSNIRMENNQYRREAKVTFEVPSSSPVW